MREEERQLGSRDISSSVISVPATAPELNLANCQFSQTELNKIVLDFLVMDGRLEIADVFRQETGLPKAVDNGQDQVRVSVRDDIMDGEVDSAIRKLNDAHPELLDESNQLHFHLLQQQLIELIRKGDMNGAIKFAQDLVARKGCQTSADSKILSELEQTLALLAFPKAQDSPFGHLLAPTQREQVAREANSAILVEQGQRSISDLQRMLSLILWCEGQLDSKRIDHPKLEGLFKNL